MAENTVVAWAADLIFAARIRAAAESSATPLRLVRNGDELLAAARAEHPRLASRVSRRRSTTSTR